MAVTVTRDMEHELLHLKLGKVLNKDSVKAQWGTVGSQNRVFTGVSSGEGYMSSSASAGATGKVCML